MTDESAKRNPRKIARAVVAIAVVLMSFVVVLYGNHRAAAPVAFALTFIVLFVVAAVRTMEGKGWLP